MKHARDMLGLACCVLKVAILLAKLVEILMRITGGVTNYRAKYLLSQVPHSQGPACLCPHG